ncbi:MAG: DUF4349 domain-containing protein [Mucilaginibacter sp.]
MKTYLIAAVLILAFAGCKRKENVEDAKLAVPTSIVLPKKSYAPSQVKFPPPVVKQDAEMVGNADEKAKVADESVTVKDTSKKIIKEGDISFEAKDIAATRKALLSTLSKLGGYADEDNESVNSEDARKEYTIKARIPAGKFEIFLNYISSGAVKIDSKHISIADVTTQYIDMTTRLHNQKVLETTYIGLLKRASKMSDVLEVEDKLTDTRTEIESEQGQLNYMSKQIAYSSLDITFYTKQVQHETGTGSAYKLASAFSAGWELLQGLFFGIISIWPVILLTVAIIILTRRWRKRRMIKQ